MRYTPADGYYLERWEVADGVVLGIANEQGDVVAYVHRTDGTGGHSYGGPVYDPPEFLNCCDRTKDDPWWPGADTWVCDHKTDMTAAERATADAFARKVGWMPPPGQEASVGPDPAGVPCAGSQADG